MTEFFLLGIVVALLIYLLGCPLGVLIVLPGGTQMSGSEGGTVYSHNRYGAYRRNRSVPVNPNTDRQVTVRNIVRALTIAWANTLSQAQRDAWDLYAANVDWLNKLGQTVNLTGLNHYVRSNTPRLQTAQARVDAAPVIFNLATAELALTVTASEATQQLTVSYDDTAPWNSEDGAAQFFAQGLPQNGSIRFFNGPWRIFAAIAGNAGAPSVSPLVVFGNFPFAQGQRLWIRSRISRADARLSEFAQFNFLAGP